MNWIRRRVVILCLVGVLGSAVTAQAFIPLVWIGYAVGAELAPYVATALGIHVATAVGLIVYNMEPSGADTTKMDTSRITRDSKVTWVDLNTSVSPSVPAIESAKVKATVSLADLAAVAGLNASDAKAAKYPNLHGALTKSNAPKWPTELMSTKVIDGRVVQITSGRINALNDWDGRSTEWFGGGTYNAPPYVAVPGSDGAPGNPALHDSAKYYYQIIAAVPPAGQRPATTVETNTAMTGTPPVAGVDISVMDTFKGEIDDFVHNEPNVVHFEDGPYTPLIPPVAMTRDAADSAVRAAATSAAVTAAAATASAAASASAATAAGAKAASDAAAAAAAAAGGTNAGLNAAAAAAKGASDAAAAAAGAAATAAGAAAAAAAAADEKVNDTPVAVPEGDARKTLDFTPMDGIKDALANTYPFNLPASIASYYSALVKPAAAPVFTIPMPLGGPLVIDLAIFEPIAVICRYLLGLCASAGIMFYIVHFFRGIS